MSNPLQPRPARQGLSMPAEKMFPNLLIEQADSFIQIDKKIYSLTADDSNMNLSDKWLLNFTRSEVEKIKRKQAEHSFEYNIEAILYDISYYINRYLFYRENIKFNSFLRSMVNQMKANQMDKNSFLKGIFDNIFKDILSRDNLISHIAEYSLIPKEKIDSFYSLTNVSVEEKENVYIESLLASFPEKDLGNYVDYEELNNIVIDNNALHFLNGKFPNQNVSRNIYYAKYAKLSKNIGGKKTKKIKGGKLEYKKMPIGKIEYSDTKIIDIVNIIKNSIIKSSIINMKFIKQLDYLKTLEAPFKPYLTKGMIFYYKDILDNLIKILEENENATRGMMRFFLEMKVILYMYRSFFEAIYDSLENDNMVINHEQVETHLLLSETELLHNHYNGLFSNFQYIIRPLLDMYKRNNTAQSVSVFCKINDFPSGLSQEELDKLPDLERQKIIEAKNTLKDSIERLEHVNKNPIFKIKDRNDKILEVRNFNCGIGRSSSMKELKFNKVFKDTSSQGLTSYMAVSNCINNLQGIMLFTFGYSGVGKSYTLFGNSQVNGILQSILQSVSNVESIDFAAYELYGMMSLKKVKDENDKIVLSADSMQGKRYYTFDCRDDGCTIGGTYSVERHQNMKLDAVNKHLNSIQESIDKYRKTANRVDLTNDKKVIAPLSVPTITRTQNNPDSSRSLLIYEFYINKEIAPNTYAKIPFVIVDMPGKELIENSYGSEGKFVLNIMHDNENVLIDKRNLSEKNLFKELDITNFINKINSEGVPLPSKTLDQMISEINDNKTFLIFNHWYSIFNSLMSLYTYQSPEYIKKVNKYIALYRRIFNNTYLNIVYIPLLDILEVNIIYNNKIITDLISNTSQSISVFLNNNKMAGDLDIDENIIEDYVKIYGDKNIKNMTLIDAIKKELSELDPTKIKKFTCKTNIWIDNDKYTKDIDKKRKFERKDYEFENNEAEQKLISSFIKQTYTDLISKSKMYKLPEILATLIPPYEIETINPETKQKTVITITTEQILLRFTQIFEGIFINENINGIMKYLIEKKTGNTVNRTNVSEYNESKQYLDSNLIQEDVIKQYTTPIEQKTNINQVTTYTATLDYYYMFLILSNMSKNEILKKKIIANMTNTSNPNQTTNYDAQMCITQIKMLKDFEETLRSLTSS